VTKHNGTIDFKNTKNDGIETHCTDVVEGPFDLFTPVHIPDFIIIVIVV